jgi:surface antigen
MHPYRIKEIMWIVIVLMFFLLSLAGCSSGPKARSEQFCDLKTITKVQRDLQGVIIGQKTEETMVCSDNRIERMAIKKAGVAQNCSEYSYYVTLKGRPTEQRGLACEKFNGTWEIVPNYGYQ